MPDMDAIYAWTVDDDGGEGIIAASHPLLGGVLALLQHRRRDIAASFRPIAEQHRRRTGHKVRFVRFDRGEDLEELP